MYYGVKLPQSSSHSDQASTDTVSLNIWGKYLPRLTSDYRPGQGQTEMVCIVSPLELFFFLLRRLSGMSENSNNTLNGSFLPAMKNSKKSK